MTPEQHQRGREVFLAACRAPVDEREALLVAELGDKPELLEHVRGLLGVHLKSPAGSAAKTWQIGEQADQGPVRNFATGHVLSGRFQIIELLGVGGMGEVYRAQDLNLKQVVALKFLPPQFASESRWLEKLRHEVRIARQITHHNICRVYDFHDGDGEQFLSMEYVDGESLHALLRRIGRLPHEKAVQTARQICAGLAAAHARNILHRDLKPANIMLDADGQVRIMDFGLAAVSEHIRRADIRSGTPAYMSPEQLAGVEVTPQSDIYAVGLIMLELFGGASASIGSAGAGAGPQPELPADVEPRVRVVIRRCIAPNPADRPASALALAAELPGGDVLAMAESIGVMPTPSLVAAASDAKPSMMLVIGLVAAIVGLIAIQLVALSRAHPVVRAAMPKAPQVLADRARQILQDAVAPPYAPYEALGLTEHVPLDLFESDSISPDQVLATAKGRPRLFFWFRCGPSPLVARDALRVVFGAGRVSIVDPPLGAGESLVVLNPSGQARLVHHRRAGPENAAPGSVARAESSLSAATGLTPRPTPTAPASTSSAPTEFFRSISLSESDGAPVQAKLTVDRRFVDFRAVQSDPTLRAQWVDVVNRSEHAYWTHALLLFGLLCVSAPLAWRNTARGRADIIRANRVAAVVFGVRLVAALLQATHSGDATEESRLLMLVAAGALAEAAVVWMFYCALEPWVRMYWPRTLITWTRLLSARGRDSLVGSHILIGCVLGAFWALLVRLDAESGSLWEALVLRQRIRPPDFFAPLMSLRVAAGDGLEAIRGGAYYALLLLLMLVLLRRLTKRPIVAGCIAAALLALLFIPRSGNPAVTLVLFGAGVAGVAVAALIRFGLLSVFVGIVVLQVLNRAPIGADPRAWYFESGTLAVLGVLAIAAYGLWAATADRRAPDSVRLPAAS